MNPRRILGVDPGLQRTGYGVLDHVGDRFTMVEAGVIRSTAKLRLEARVNEIFSGIREVIDDLHPDCMILEQLFSHYERPQTAILMGHARGAICLAAAQHALEVLNIEPTRVKRIMTGNGRAPKSQMQSAVRMQLKLPSDPEPPDVADALAIAIAGGHMIRQSVDGTF